MGSELLLHRYTAAFALVGFLIGVPSWCNAGSFIEDQCDRQVDVQKILETAISAARSYGYKTDTMFMEFEGPMHWQTLTNSRSVAVELHPSQIKQWNHELANHCLWSIYFGCEPPHVTSGSGFEGCTDYPPELWLLVESGSGKVLHSVRYTGTDARPRIDE